MVFGSDDREYAQTGALPDWLQNFAEAELKKASPFDDIKNMFKTKGDLDAVEAKVQEIRDRVGLDKLVDENHELNKTAMRKIASSNIAQQIKQWAILANELDLQGDSEEAMLVDQKIKTLLEQVGLSKRATFASDSEEHLIRMWKAEPEVADIIKRTNPSDFRLDVHDKDKYKALFLQGLFGDDWEVIDSKFHIKELGNSSEYEVNDQRVLDDISPKRYYRAEDAPAKDSMPKSLKEYPKIKKFIDNLCHSRRGHIDLSAIIKMLRDERPEKIDIDESLKKYIKEKLKQEKEEVHDEGDEVAGMNYSVFSGSEDDDGNKEMFSTPAKV